MTGDELRNRYERLKNEVGFLESFLPRDLHLPPSISSKSVLEIDLSGFTARTQDALNQGELATAKWINRIGSDVYRSFDPIERKYKGVIQYHEGDAALATFDNAVDAVLAAVAVQEGIDGLSPEVLGDGSKLKLRKRQGIATGNVFTATVGNEHRRIRVIDGPAVEQAVFVEGNADINGIVRIDKTTYERDGHFEYRKEADYYELLRKPDSASSSDETRVVRLPVDFAREVEVLERKKRELLSYFPPLARDEVQGKRSGKTEQATIMFATLPSLQKLVSHYSGNPDKLAEAYDAHFSVVRNLVEEEHGGEIDKLYRSKMMARLRKQGHFDAAQSIALQLPGRIRNDEHVRDLLGEAGIVDTKIPIRGYSKGVVYVGPVGTENRRAFTALGDRVNMAARAMVAAKDNPKGVLTDQGRGNTLFVEKDLKGIGRTKLFMPSTDNLTRTLKKKQIIGRDKELKQISDIIDGFYQSKKTQLVNIAGDAGYGKTELTKEFERMFKEQGGFVYRGSAVEQAKDIPDYLFQDFVRNALKLQSTDTKEQVKAKLEGIADAEARKVVHHWLGLSLGYEKPAGSKEDIEKARREALLKVADTSKPSLFVFNDLHWVDLSSFETIKWLNKNLPNSVILTNYRPKEVAMEIIGTRIELGAFDAHGTSEMLEHLVRSDVDASLVEFVQKQSQGIPLYIEEIVHFLEDDGLLKDGKLTRAVDKIEVPDSIEKLVLQRYRNLKSAEKQIVLDYASCMFGDETPLELLASALGYTLNETIMLAHALERADFVRVQNGTVAFKHNLTRKAVYERAVLADDRVKMHTKIGDARKELFGEGDDQKVALAWDYENGDSIEKLVRYNYLAAKMFVDNNQSSTCLTFAEKATKNENVTDSARKDYVLALNVTAVALMRLLKAEETTATFDKAFKFAEGLEGKDKAEVLAKLFNCRGVFRQYTLKDVDGARVDYESALPLLAQLGDRRVEAMTLGNIAQCQKGDEKIATNLRVASIFEELGDKKMLAMVYNNLTNPLREKGDFDRAREVALKGINIAREIKDSEKECRGLFGMALISSAEKKFDSCNELFREAEVLAVKSERFELLSAIYDSWSSICMENGNPIRALSICNQWLDLQLNSKLKEMAEKRKKEIESLIANS